MKDEKAALLGQLTNEDIESICASILDGHSPESRANVYASTSQEWPALAEELAFLLRSRITKAPGNTSDGYHTFDELYDHRITLFIALCYQFDSDPDAEPMFEVWRSKLHSDGSAIDGWFVMGIMTKPGEQITYHIPMGRWDETDFVVERERAPEFDGHTSADVLMRLREFYR